MARKRPIEEFFTSDIITLLVGSEAVKFTAHEKVLAQAKYFSGCLEGNFPEKASKQIEMPTEDPFVIQKLLGFLYFGKIKTPTFESQVREDGERTFMALLAKTYVAADKFCMEECQNYIADLFVKTYARRLACPEAISELGDLPESPLRRYLITKLAHSLGGDRGKDYRDVLEKDSSILQLISNGGQDAEDLFIACLDVHITPVNLGARPCTWHVHNLTPVC